MGAWHYVLLWEVEGRSSMSEGSMLSLEQLTDDVED